MKSRCCTCGHKSTRKSTVNYKMTTRFIVDYYSRTKGNSTKRLFYIKTNWVETCVKNQKKNYYSFVQLICLVHLSASRRLSLTFVFICRINGTLRQVISWRTQNRYSPPSNPSRLRRAAPRRRLTRILNANFSIERRVAGSGYCSRGKYCLRTVLNY